MIQKQFHVLSKSKCTRTESTPHANRESISLHTGWPEEPRAQGLCSSTKCPRHQVLHGQLAEGDERPAVKPLAVDPVAAELTVADIEVGRRGVEAAIGVTPAAVVLRDRDVVALEPAGTTPLGEGTRVAVEAEVAEVLAHRLGVDIGTGCELRLPDQHLEALATPRDLLAIVPPVVVPLLVVGVEVGEVELALRECRQVDGREVRDDDDVAVGDRRSPEGVTAHALLRLLRAPVVDNETPDGIPRVTPLRGDEAVERLERNVHPLTRLQEVVSEPPHQTQTALQGREILAHDRLCSAVMVRLSSLRPVA